jgi:hypothetical protein
MERLDLLLAGSLYVPVAIAAALWLHRPPRAGERAGIFFAFTWCAVSLLAVHAAALRFDWWRFDATGPGLFGFPVELQIGWAILWGVLPALAPLSLRSSPRWSRSISHSCRSSRRRFSSDPPGSSEKRWPSGSVSFPRSCFTGRRATTRTSPRAP